MSGMSGKCTFWPWAAEAPQPLCVFLRWLLGPLDALAKGDTDASGWPPLLGTTTRCILALSRDACASGRLLENTCKASTPGSSTCYLRNIADVLALSTSIVHRRLPALRPDLVSAGRKSIVPICSVKCFLSRSRARLPCILS